MSAVPSLAVSRSNLIVPFGIALGTATVRTCELKEVDGKGLGVVAMRDIKAGELMLKETPFLVSSHDNDWPTLELAVNNLPPPQRAIYDALCTSTPYDHLPKALNIFKTNSFRLGMPTQQAGVFDRGSRFNHSCRPNCSSHWDDEQGVRWFIANREIRKGEEICITYGDIREARSERRKWLKTTFGFDCGCEACSYSDEQTSESDRRRIEIKQIEASTARTRLQPLQLIKQVNIALKLQEEEGIVLGAASLAFEALTTAVWFGERMNGIRWIYRTLELLELECGKWSTRYKGVEAWKGEPTLHPSWNDACNQMGIPSQVLAGPE